MEYISIYEPYGEREAQLSEDDVSDIVQQLSQVNLTGSGTQDYAADFLLGYAMYHIRLKNGMEFDFSAWRPYYVINTENFREKFGRSLGAGSIATGSGYRIEPGSSTGCFDIGYNYRVCSQLQETYHRLCAAYFYREGV